ncbi:MAG: methyl-accepting chemotaxis protein [Nitrospinota bacterium]|nr:methyl-accepting chemotaxis protein [Nitrospinota bacterium]
MKYVANMKIGKKIALMLLPLLMSFLFFAVNGIVEKKNISEEMSALYELSDLAVKLSALVHETQKERGATAGFLGSKGNSFGTILSDQRKQTDVKTAELKQFLETFDALYFGAELKKALDHNLEDLEEIESIRSSVAKLDIETGKAIGYYTDMNAGFLDIIASMVKICSNAEISTMTMTYSNFLKGKERAGIERAVGSNTFAADKFGKGMFNKYSELVSQQKVYTELFVLLATEGQIAYFNDKMKSPAVSEVENMRNILFEKSDTGMFGISSTKWFETITVKINLLKEVEDRLSGDLKQKAGDLKQGAYQAMLFYLTLSAVVLVISIALGVVIGRDISGPIARMMSLIDELSKGRLDVSLKMERKDEIGMMVTSLNAFAENLSDVIGEINMAADQVSTSSDQVSSASQSLSQGSTESAASLEQITSSLTQIGSQTKLNAENATQANTLSTEARKMAEDGNQQMDEMVAAVAEINESSKNISKIIKAIDEIAFQTNLLALNAAVEAARAGRHGKGFAVVAEEVRNLAARSAKAAEETADLIEGSVKKAENGATIASRTSKSLTDIVRGVTKVADLVEEIAGASNEQAQGISQVSQALGQIDQVTQQNTANAEQSAAASEELAGQAINLKEMLSRFRTREQNYGRNGENRNGSESSDYPIHERSHTHEQNAMDDEWDMGTDEEVVAAYGSDGNREESFN